MASQSFFLATRKCGIPSKNAKSQWIQGGDAADGDLGTIHEKYEHKPAFYACRQDSTSAN